METNVKFLAAALAAACLTGSFVAANEPESDKAEDPGITEIRVFVQGDAYFEARKKMLGEAGIAEPFITKVHYPENWDWASKGSILFPDANLVDGRGIASAKIVIDPGPTPPDTTPPVGTQGATGASCYARRSHGGVVEYGSIKWEWTYGYRVDSDGDGKKDSDPGWYLTTETFTPYQETQQNPIMC